jgi:uncharacterized protein YlxW (UPF0749 family)
MALPYIEIEHLIQGIAVLQLLGFVLIVSLIIVLSKTRKTLKKMFKGAKASDLEELILHHQNEIARLQKDLQFLRAEVTELQSSLKKVKGKVGIVRYSAFDHNGSDLSFSIAIVNEEKTGVVLTGLHNREQTYIYSKPVTDGISPYTLSKEEQGAIHKALESK